MEKKEQLLKLVSTFSKEIESYKSKTNILNEQSIRQQYIDVFLNLLGWDITNAEGLPYNYREVVAEEYSQKKIDQIIQLDLMV